jgi:nucleotide-binding universal stress UspA family protein
MYTKILVPLDGSKRAERILSHVEHLAERYDATVIFIRVIEPVVHYVEPEGAAIRLQDEEIRRRNEEAERYLAGWEGEFRSKRIQARKIVEYGSVVETIISVADQESVDLVAIASHGRSGLARVFYGSVAAGILARVDRPLLVIRSRRETASD